jgi:hypothetical protein
LSTTTTKKKKKKKKKSFSGRYSQYLVLNAFATLAGMFGMAGLLAKDNALLAALGATAVYLVIIFWARAAVVTCVMGEGENVFIWDADLLFFCFLFFVFFFLAATQSRGRDSPGAAPADCRAAVVHCAGGFAGCASICARAAAFAAPLRTVYGGAQLRVPRACLSRVVARALDRGKQQINQQTISSKQNWGLFSCDCPRCTR